MNSLFAPSKPAPPPPWLRLVLVYLFLYGITGLASECLSIIINVYSEWGPVMNLVQFLGANSFPDALWPLQSLLRLTTCVAALMFSWRLRNEATPPTRQILQLGVWVALFYAVSCTANILTLFENLSEIRYYLFRTTATLLNLAWILALVYVGVRPNRFERPAAWIILITLFTAGVDFLLSESAWRWSNNSWPWTIVLQLFEAPRMTFDVFDIGGEPIPSWISYWGLRISILQSLSQDVAAIVPLVIGLWAIVKREIPRVIAILVMLFGVSKLLFPVLHFSIGSMGFAGDGWHILTWMRWSCEPGRLVLLGLFLWFFLKDLRFREGPEHPVCKFCGYNLTGNISGRCPECGLGVDRVGAGAP